MSPKKLQKGAEANKFGGLFVCYFSIIFGSNLIGHLLECFWTKLVASLEPFWEPKLAQDGLKSPIESSKGTKRRIYKHLQKSKAVFTFWVLSPAQEGKDGA